MEVLTCVLLMMCKGVSAAFVKQDTLEGNRQLHALMCLGLIKNTGRRVTAVIYAPFFKMLSRVRLTRVMFFQGLHF